MNTLKLLNTFILKLTETSIYKEIKTGILIDYLVKTFVGNLFCELALWKPSI